MKTITALIKNVHCYMHDSNDDQGQEARENIEEIVSLFLGNGFEYAEYDFENSRPNKLIITGNYHNMDENGYYCGYTDWKAILRPDLKDGYTCSVTVKNGTIDTKNYIYDSLKNYLDNTEYGDKTGHDQQNTKLVALWSLINARKNCYMSGSMEWMAKHDENIKNFLKDIEQETGLYDLSVKFSQDGGNLVFTGLKDDAERQVRFLAVAKPDFGIDIGFNVKTEANLSPLKKAMISANLMQYLSALYEEPKDSEESTMSM